VVFKRAGPPLIAAIVALTAAAARAGDASDAREEIRTVLFGGFDAGSASFVSAGAKHTFGPADRDGPLVMAGAGYGARFERDGAAPRPAPVVMRHTLLAHAVGGWQWTFDWGVVAAMAGPEMSYERVGSRFAQQPGARFGGRIHGEVWARPGEDTLLTATLIAGSARGDAWGRLSWGWRVWGIYLGPEAARYADLTGYRKTSLGLHATGLEFWGLTFRVSAGYLREERARRDGGYVALAVWTAL
jgi:hypothetical protein